MNRTASSFAHLSDDAILTRVTDGELDAYEGIMRHHNQRLFRIARSIVTDDAEAMDIVQETFITAYEKLDGLKNPAALPAWLARVARNTALMRLRKSRRVTYVEEPDFDNVVELSTSMKRPEQPDVTLSNTELRLLLERLIDALPEAFREVFMLRAIEMCSVATTAEILEIPQATVKTRYHRARLLLQKGMMDYGDAIGVEVYEFAGHRCDTVVRNVLAELRADYID